MVRRYLWLAFLIGLGGAARALTGIGSPVDIPITITGGGGIACAVGPNAPSVPAPAAAAGFTTCAANYDFGSAQFSNPATYIDCMGAGSPIFWNGADGGFRDHTLTCNGGSYSTVTDSGVTALLQSLGSVPDTPHLINAITSAPFNGNGTITLPNAGVTFPNAFYIEAKVKQPGVGGGNSDWFFLSATPNSPYVEEDIGEMNNFNRWCGGSNTNLAGYESHCFPNADAIQQWHTLGERFTTTSNASQVAICLYDDGPSYPTQQGCTTTTPGDPSVFIERVSLYLYNFNAVGGGPAFPNGPFSTEWAFIRIWVCPNWQAGGAAGGLACANGLVTSNP